MAAGWVFAALCTVVSIAYFSEIKAATQSLLGVQEPTAARVAAGEREGRTRPEPQLRPGHARSNSGPVPMATSTRRPRSTAGP